jgi:hypothetical protein
MAKSTVAKAAPAEPAQKEKKTKAQAEYERYKQSSVQAPYGFAPVQGFQPAGPVVFRPIGQGGPSWAFPPSVAVMPSPGSPGGYVAASPSSGGTLVDGLGSTLRLGVDAVNAMLTGGIRILTGFSAYGAGECSCGGSCGCSCGCSHESCCDRCETECGGYDCCCLFRETCCQPSVGRCC